jgi:hypothetical protein
VTHLLTPFHVYPNALISVGPLQSTQNVEKYLSSASTSGSLHDFRFVKLDWFLNVLFDENVWKPLPVSDY